jgi:subtilisin family serine protease
MPHTGDTLLARSFGQTRLSSAPGSQSTTPLDLVNLTPLMERSSGRPDIIIALIDGPVIVGHPELSDANIREVPGRLTGTCARASSVACMHGTFVAGILSARRGSAAPAICPNCTLLVRPIFPEEKTANGQLPSATPEELATAIVDCIESGAHVVNLSAALARPSSKGEQCLERALDHAAQRGVIVVAAAGNQGALGSSAITRHAWVIPVVACDHRGRPISYTNLGQSIGRRGLSAPGHYITSIGANGTPPKFGGTSAAAPFVTGTIALLRSEFPAATPGEVKLAVTQASGQRRATVVPPLLNAWAAYQFLRTVHSRR